MRGLTRDGRVEPVSRRNQIFKHERGQGKFYFPCSADDHEQDWQPYTVDPYSPESADHISYPSHGIKFSSTNGDRGIFIFPVQLTTRRIGNLTRFIHTLLKG